jgi:hypothetical protein
MKDRKTKKKNTQKKWRRNGERKQAEVQDKKCNTYCVACSRLQDPSVPTSSKRNFINLKFRSSEYSYGSQTHALCQQRAQDDQFINLQTQRLGRQFLSPYTIRSTVCLHWYNKCSSNDANDHCWLLWLTSPERRRVKCCAGCLYASHRSRCMIQRNFPAY